MPHSQQWKKGAATDTKNRNTSVAREFKKESKKSISFEIKLIVRDCKKAVFRIFGQG